MKPLLDEMWAPAIAEALRDRDHEVAAVAERGDSNHTGNLLPLRARLRLPQPIHERSQVVRPEQG